MKKIYYLFKSFVIKKKIQKLKGCLNSGKLYLPYEYRFMLNKVKYLESELNRISINI